MHDFCILSDEVEGSHPGSSSFFVGHTRQLETKTFGRTNDVERENAKNAGAATKDGRTGRRTWREDVKNDSVRKNRKIRLNGNRRLEGEMERKINVPTCVI